MLTSLSFPPSSILYLAAGGVVEEEEDDDGLLLSEMYEEEEEEKYKDEDGWSVTEKHEVQEEEKKETVCILACTGPRIDVSTELPGTRSEGSRSRALLAPQPWHTASECTFGTDYNNISPYPDSSFLLLFSFFSFFLEEKSLMGCCTLQMQLMH